MPVRITNKPFSKMLVSEIDYDYIQKLWIHIRDDVSTHKANHTFKVLKLVWNEGFRAGKIKANPYSLLKLPKLPDRQVMWTLDQIDGMVKYCDEHGYYSMGSMITMCYEFCQRPVDVRLMKWSNIDGRAGVSNFIQKKTGKRMALKVTNAVQARLHLHKHRNSDDFIFAYENTGRPFTDDRCNKHFRKLADGYGLPKVPLEDQFNDDGSQKYSNIWLSDLRRTGITHASRAGCTDRQLMGLSGHKNPQMLVVYAVEGEIESTEAQRKRGLL
jgi:integrase